MPRKTDSSNPADWIFIASGYLEGIRLLASQKVSFAMCLSKLAEVVEKILKAELIRTGWYLVKTHDLVKLVDELRERDIELADLFQPLCENLAEKYFADRYPGFDLEDADWSMLCQQIDQISDLLNEVKARVGS